MCLCIRHLISWTLHLAQLPWMSPDSCLSGTSGSASAPSPSLAHPGKKRLEFRYWVFIKCTFKGCQTRHCWENLNNTFYKQKIYIYKFIEIYMNNTIHNTYIIIYLYMGLHGYTMVPPSCPTPVDVS